MLQARFTFHVSPFTQLAVQTNLADFIKDTSEGREADAILRKCVHCGFCTATCPTYQLLGDELDGPRGRIYLIKQVLEGTAPTSKTQLHLDRCLTCRSCETTCPSGVRYGRLLEIGRPVVEQQVGRSRIEALKREALRAVIPNRAVFSALARLGQATRSLLPAALRRKVPPRPAPARPWPGTTHARRMLLLDACGQPALSPATNAAAARVLDRLGITLVRALGVGCCGALSLHLGAQEEALGYMRRNIDAWWLHVERGVEAILTTASGCGVTVKEYGELLQHDAAYADKARRISALARDISEVLSGETAKLKALILHPSSFILQRVVFHAPCTLQHGMKLKGGVETLLTDLGFSLAPIADAHLCCGSAGTYSILQPELSQRLLANKIAALTAHSPAAILTANIGCQSHLQTATQLPVRHWIEALDDILTA
jgi:glycolate oxidase iron-sulfur subunit